MKIIIKPSINVCTAVGKEKGGRAICRRNYSMYIHNYFDSVSNKTIDKSEKSCYTSYVEERINSFRVVE